MTQNVNYGFQFQEIEFLLKNKANGDHLHSKGVEKITVCIKYIYIYFKEI